MPNKICVMELAEKDLDRWTMVCHKQGLNRAQVMLILLHEVGKVSNEPKLEGMSDD